MVVVLKKKLNFLLFLLSLLLSLLLPLINGQDVSIDYKPEYKLTVSWSLPPATPVADYEVQCTDDKTVGVYVKKNDALTLTDVTLVALRMCIDYECRLRNTKTSVDLKTFPVRIEAPIPTIQSLTAKEITQGGFTFSFVPTDNVDTVKCGPLKFSYQLLKDSVVESVVDDLTVFQARLSNLFPKTKYTIQVRAALTSENGATGPWVTTDVTTLDGILSAPRNLRLYPGIPQAGNDVIVQWDPPQNLQNYQVFYKIKAKDDNDRSELIYESFETDMVLDNLNFCSSYTSEVAAGTVAMENAPTIMSDFSPSLKFTTDFPTELGPVTNIHVYQVGENSAQVIFTQQDVLLQNQRCSFANVVKVYSENGAELPKFETLSKDSAIVVNNLDFNSTYGFNVITKSSDGSVVSREDPNNLVLFRLQDGFAFFGSEGGPLKWWHILLIVLGVLLVIGVFLSIIF